MRFKKVLTWTLSVCVLMGLAYLLGYSKLLVVKAINIQGLSQTSEISSVLSKGELHLKVGGQLARVDVKGSERELKNLNWIKSAKVGRNWINGEVLISLTPRTPIAQLIGPDFATNSYIDKSGKIFNPPINPGQLPGISLADKSQAENAALFVSQFPAELLAKMKNLEINSKGGANMETSDGNGALQIIWGESKEIALKVAIYNRLLALPENSKISGMDLENPANPVVTK